MGISNAEFDALVGNLVMTTNKIQVGEERSKLFSVLSLMRQDIVERR